MALTQLIQLQGGFPWGFRLHQDHLGIRVQRVRPNSKAASSGLLEGDRIVRINQIDCKFSTLRQVNILIDQSIDLLNLHILRLENKCNTPSSVDRTYIEYGGRQHLNSCSGNKNYARTINEHRATSLSRFIPSTKIQYGVFNNISATKQLPEGLNNKPLENHNPHSSTLQVIHKPTSKINFLRSTVNGNLSDTSCIKPIHSVTRNESTYNGRGYASDTDSWHRAELSFRPKRSYASNFVEQTLSNTVDTRDVEQPINRMPKFHVVRRASVEPSILSNFTCSTPTPSRLTRGVSFSNTGGPTEYEGYLTDVFHRNVQRLGSVPKQLSKRSYTDSMIRGGNLVQYPTIEEQKRLAKRIASILENADPALAKNEFDGISVNKAYVNFNSEHTGNKGSTTAYSDYPLTTDDEELAYSSSRFAPYGISGKSTNQNDILKNVPSKVHSIKEHAIKNEVHPDIYRGIANQSNYCPDKGTQLFQKRKARCEKWIVHSDKPQRNNLRYGFYSDSEAQMPNRCMIRKTSIQPLHIKDNNTKYFNAIPQGWNSINAAYAWRNVV